MWNIEGVLEMNEFCFGNDAMHFEAVKRGILWRPRFDKEVHRLFFVAEVTAAV
jgi:hypothetical protein